MAVDKYWFEDFTKGRQFPGAVHVLDAGAFGLFAQMTGDAQGLGGSVAFEALVGSSQSRPVGSRLWQGVKDRPKFRVCHGYFHQRGTGNEADINIIIEENGARALRRDALALE